MEDFEAKYERLAEEQDSAERAMSQAYYLITGKSPEWSNIFGYEEALEEINTAQYLLRTEEGPMIKRYWTTFHDGFYCLEIAPEGKGFWVKYLDHVKELEQEQVSHAETRKLLLKACHEFENFHRSLCERFGYVHDPVDWKRDQVSLIEHIASLIPAWRRDLGAPPPAPVAPETCGFYDALDKHVRNGVIAAAVDIGRHHQELIRLDESRTDEKLLKAIAAADAEADRLEGRTPKLGAYRNVFDAGGNQ